MSCSIYLQKEVEEAIHDHRKDLHWTSVNPIPIPSSKSRLNCTRRLDLRFQPCPDPPSRTFSKFVTNLSMDGASSFICDSLDGIFSTSMGIWEIRLKRQRTFPTFQSPQWKGIYRYCLVRQPLGKRIYGLLHWGLAFKVPSGWGNCGWYCSTAHYMAWIPKRMPGLDNELVSALDSHFAPLFACCARFIILFPECWMPALMPNYSL